MDLGGIYTRAFYRIFRFVYCFLMLPKLLRICLIFLYGCFLASSLSGQGRYLEWEAVISQSDGFAGAFTGVHQGKLLRAGGWDTIGTDSSGREILRYQPQIFIGSKAAEQIRWEKAGKTLPEPLAEGLALSIPEGLLCIGGKNERGISAKVQLIAWGEAEQSIKIKDLPPLPVPLHGASGCAHLGEVYVAGVGDDQQNHFFLLDISLPGSQQKWERLDGCPGPPRSFGSAAIQNDGIGSGFYLFGGQNPKEIALPLNDAWRFDLQKRVWKAIAPIAVKGKPYHCVGMPAIKAGVHHLLLFGAKEGPFPNSQPSQTLAYHSITNTWALVDTSAATVSPYSSVNWMNGNILLSGPDSSNIWEIKPIPAPSGLEGWDYVVIILYLIILVGMGAHFMRRGITTEDYFKAGKRIPWWAAGISIFGTSLSAITYMAVPAKAYSTDWGYFFLSMSQILTVPLVIWLVLPFFRRLNVTTAYEYLERRFHVAVRLIGGLAFLLFQFGRIGIVLFLPAIALSVVTGVSIQSCIIVMAILSIFYTVLGGIEAVIWTDVKQVIVLTAGAVICLILMASGVEGGFDSLIDIAAADNKMQLANLDFDFSSPTLWVVLGGGIGTNLINQTSDQTFVQRYLTTKDEKAAARSLLTPAVLVLPVSLLFFGLGTALYSFFKTNPEALNPVLENADAIFPWYIVSQLPAGLSGLLIAGIFAASMSSLDSSLNSAATVITVDFYKRFSPKGGDQHYLRTARIVTVITGLVGMAFALLMAGFEIKSLWDEFSKILGLFAGGLAGMFLLGMSSKRATTGGALIGFVASAGVQYWVSSTGAVHFLLYTLTGLLSCYVVGWLASWLFPQKEDLRGLTIGTIREIEEGESQGA